MDDLSRRLLPFDGDRGTPRRHRDDAYFLVTSWGHCGSIWLAGSLNLHPAVCAIAGIDNPIEAFHKYPLHRDAAFVAQNAREALRPYGFTNWYAGELDGLRSQPVMAAFTPPQRDQWRLPWYVFDELDQVPGERPYTVRGNVHGTMLTFLHEAGEQSPQLFGGRQVVVLDLIRHPVTRTESAIKATMHRHLGALDERITAFLHEHAVECSALERQYGVDFAEPRARAALHVFRQGLQNDVWASEIGRFPDVPRLLIERLQADPDYFAWMFGTVAQGRLIADEGYLDRVFAAENLRSGRQSAEEGRPPDPRAQYDRWSAFERDEFARIAARLNLPAVYFEFGYDLSFLTRSRLGGGSWFADMLASGSSRA